MAFLEKEDLKTVIRDYQLDAITNNDDSIVTAAIDMAIEEASSILTPNDKKEWNDGRKHYDVAAIFGATGDARNPLMLGNVKTIAIWYLLDLCDTGLEYEEAKDRYDRSIKYLKDLAKGVFNSGTLPVIATEPPVDELPFAMGSRPKFNHDY